MDGKVFAKALAYRGATKLAASVDRKDFGAHLLRFISDAARIDNFGAFYASELGKVTPVLSVWSGKISSYRFRRNAAEILAHTSVKDEIVEKIRTAPGEGALIERWHPPAGDPRIAMYARAGVLEKVSISTRLGRGGFQSFFLRSFADGWLTDREFAGLEDVLPFAHELIGLRHRLAGSESFQFVPGLSASSLRERNVMAFAALSKREAEVCDCLVKGVTVAGTAVDLGIAESTVRTLRQRAYRKLRVASANELMALMLHDRQFAGDGNG